MNLENITAAIVAADISSLAKEEAARLAEAFVEALPRFPDTRWESVALECPWYMLLRPKTLTVGVMDRIAQDPAGVIWGCEWKSRRESKLKKDGTPYKGDSEQDWLAEISSGQQVRIYALAMQRAVFLPFANKNESLQLMVSQPHLMVRAVIKAIPAFVWPSKAEDGQFTYPQPYLDATEAALINAAEAIRASRRSGRVPHALPGLHCTNKYNRICNYHEPFCSKGAHPIGPTYTTAGSTDPGWAAIEASGVDLADPEVVVLSASSLSNWSQCPEQYRILIGGYGPPQDSMALDVGTGLHVACAETFRQLRESQQPITSVTFD